MMLSPLDSYIRKEMNLDYINYLEYIQSTYKSIKNKPETLMENGQKTWKLHKKRMLKWSTDI